MSAVASTVRIAHNAVRWLCITPLGSPVVPEVYMMYSRSSTSLAISISAVEERACSVA